jgi:hypothetical protein
MISKVDVSNNPLVFSELVNQEYMIFNKAGFCDTIDINNNRLVGYDNYMSNSVFWVCKNKDTINGFTRIIKPDNRDLDSFKTISDFPEIRNQFVKFNPRNIAEIGTICIIEGGSKVLINLVKQLFYDEDPDLVIASIDYRFYQIYVKRLGLPMKKIGNEKYYMGSITLPIEICSNDALTWIASNTV